MAAVLVLAALLCSSVASLAAAQWDFEQVMYGSESRQYLYIKNATTGSGPAPIALYAHANGGRAGMVLGNLDNILDSGFSLVSWESIQSLGSLEDILTVIADSKLALAWVKANAATYDWDADRIMIMGRSRGSIASWELACSGDPAILGAYFYNGLPDGVWVPEARAVWDPVSFVTSDSANMYFTFGPPPDIDNDIHDPINIDPIIAKYDELGRSDDIALVSNFTANGIDIWADFAMFADPLLAASRTTASPPSGDSANDDAESSSTMLPSTTAAGEEGGTDAASGTGGPAGTTGGPAGTTGGPAGTTAAASDDALSAATSRRLSSVLLVIFVLSTGALC